MTLKKILYVEDDDDIRKIAALVFKLSGIELSLSESGPSALKWLETNKPDLAIIDVMMPGMSGVVLFQAIKDLGYTFPVIFMTAKTQHDEIASYRSLGVIGVISKPFDPEHLVEEIEALYMNRK